MPEDGQSEKAGERLDRTFELIERLRAGDRSAADALFARYAGPLRRWAQGRLPAWARDIADTQDLVQDTLLQTFKRIDRVQIRGEGALRAYLRQALMNRVRDELRRRDRRGAAGVLDSETPDPSPSPLEQAIGREGFERYERALSALRPSDREAVIGRLEMGYSYDELAETLEKPSTEAVRKTVRRAMARLLVEMRRDGTGSA
jgi:RNA polymerase sigma-70 factor (ECF subfamily)